MDTKQIDADFVLSRWAALETRWGGRNTRMDEYEKLYLLDLWETEPEPDEQRITVPTAFDTVETNRTILLTRAPVISVPPSDVRLIDSDQADVLEKFLYGVWSRARVLDALLDAEWYASCFGEGVVRVVYDDGAAEDEVPILVQALDPRNVFANPSGRPMIDTEIIHTWIRTRREIQEELRGRKRGKNSVWAKELRQADAGKGYEEWLDEEVQYIEYWRLDTEVVEVVDEPVQEPEPSGALARLVANARRWIAQLAPPVGFEPLVGEAPPGMDGDLLGGDLPGGDLPGGETDEETATRQQQARMVRRRVVTHCVVADQQVIKKAVRLPGYKRLPFIRYAGIKTPLKGVNGILSVLFPIAGGTGKNGAVGVAAAEAQIVALRQRLVEMFATAAMVTDDAGLTTIDLKPGALNRIGPGRTLQFLVPPGPLPTADAQVQLLKGYVEDSTFPAAMKGRYLGDISGLALSTLTNPVLMRVASRQQQREAAYQTLNEVMLQLAEEYARPGYGWPDGWPVWGEDRRGTAFELRLTPEDVGGYYRNEVKLSASLPKDQAGEVMALAQLVGQRLLSRETFLDQFQQVKGLATQSPTDEMKRILKDALLFDGDTSQQLAKLVLSDFSEELAALLAEEGQPPQGLQPPMGPGGGPPMGPGGGPMQGLPPGVVPPQAVPPAVGAGNLPGMMRMQGGPGGGPPVGPPPGKPGRGG